MASAAEAIRSAEERLEIARLGLEAMRSSPPRFQSGLFNAVVFGRTITFALQNMKHDVPSFEPWYSAHQASMRADPLMRFFVTLRNEIEKDVRENANKHVSVSSFSFGADIAKFGPPPAGNVALVLGDKYGGVGWEVTHSDGSTQMYYVEMPPAIGRATIRLEGAPEEYQTTPAADLVERYLDALDRMIQDAKKTFLAK